MFKKLFFRILLPLLLLAALGYALICFGGKATHRHAAFICCGIRGIKHLMKLLLFGMIFGCTSCGNRLTIDCNGLDSNDVEIYLSPGYPLRYNDNLSIKYEYLTLIYKNGEYYDIPNEYGENDWVVNYKNQKQCTFRHFKTNWRHRHRYKFVIYEKHDTLFCTTDIRGKDADNNTFVFTDLIPNSTTD